ncbi:hypothetical protein [Cellulomonas sp. URHD0024]|uniref:hypothetical protein n=1 Tax=Cellulomonas sp. URHD0024 TaxID=1302620 RepID=UPI00040BDAFA|nr:hypothetical protein [Cellulomonas sp. URHD0024]
MEVLDPPDSTTRYVDQVVSRLPDWIEVVYFTWRRALLTRYDVLHVHWPERLLRGGGRVKTWANRAAFVLLVVRARLLRVALVRTEHNLRPHEAGGGVEDRLIDWFRSRSTAVIRLNDATPAEPERLDRLIRHGDYREALAAHPRAEQVPGRLLYFGIIREYKGVEGLLDVFTALPDQSLTLSVVGRPSSARWHDMVVSASAADPRITSRLAFVPDDVLVAEVTAAELVVLPYLEMHNSGTVLVALSLDRTVLAPRSPANEELAAEVGSGWLCLYDGPLTEQVLLDALASTRRRASAGGRPELVGRDWDTVGDLHAQVYRDAVRRARGHVAVAGGNG